MESERRNLILTIESQRNDKRVYAGARLTEYMCKADSFGIPRLGTAEQVEAITAENGKGAELSIDNATSGMTAPFHAGAAKYFAEKGATVNVG